MADPKKGRDVAMADTRYLQKRKGVWFIRVARPPKSGGWAKKNSCTL